MMRDLLWLTDGQMARFQPFFRGVMAASWSTTVRFERDHPRLPQQAQVAGWADRKWPGKACPELVEGTKAKLE